MISSPAWPSTWLNRVSVATTPSSPLATAGFPLVAVMNHQSFLARGASGRYSDDQDKGCQTRCGRLVSRSHAEPRLNGDAVVIAQNQRPREAFVSEKLE